MSRAFESVGRCYAIGLRSSRRAVWEFWETPTARVHACNRFSHGSGLGAQHGQKTIPLGPLYALGFLAVEYLSGRLLRKFVGEAPWDYSHARLNVDGLIRLE